MKKILFLFLFVLSFSIIACYVEDPANHLQINAVAVNINNAEIVYYFPYTKNEVLGNEIGNGTWNGKQFPLNFKSAFPITINLQFLGFENNEKATRACLLYLNKQGRWQIIKDIKNPRWKIETNDGYAKSLFGSQVIKNSAGYSDGEIMFIITYFETENSSTHDLNTLLNTQETTATLTESRLQNLGAIAIGVISNRKPN